MDELLKKYCYCEKSNGTDIIVINYKSLKDIISIYGDNITQDIYNVILQKLIDTIDDVLIDNPEFTMNVFLREIVLKDVHKHRQFILQIASVMKAKYQDKLRFCYINNAPYVFQQIFAIINPFLDSKTKKKIIVNEQPRNDDILRDSDYLVAPECEL